MVMQGLWDGSVNPSGVKSLRVASLQCVATWCYQVTTRNVGLPNHIKVWHDNTGRHPDWFLEYIRIRKQNSNVWAVFPCMRWFSTALDDCRISRVLMAGHATPLITYKVRRAWSSWVGRG